MQKNIILITAAYPYGKDEISFIEPELPYLMNKARVSILSRNEAGKMIGNVPEKIKVYRIRNHRSENIYRVILCLFSPVFYKEIGYIWCKKRRHIWKNIKEALFTLAIAERTSSYIRNICRSFSAEDEIALYTYWFDEATLAACLFRERNKERNIHVVSRIHGCDLYEERTDTGYQPYMRQIDQMIDRVCFISRQGLAYYQEHYACSASDKYRLCYLGTNRMGEGQWEKTGTLRIVSCSHIIALKRVGLIVEALANIHTIRINWTHFGSGDEEGQVKKLAKELLSKKENIHYCFMGNVQNEAIHRAYIENEYDCFLSLSSTEGLPVSMMEALSYGIPIVATNVGGVSEIIDPECGILLKANPSGREAAEALERFFEMSPQEMLRKRMAAKKMWERQFNAEENFTAFAEQIIVWKK